MSEADRENYIRIIEHQPSIDDMYTDIRRIDPRAGDGNFSLVFHALDANTNHRVALKFYNPCRTGDEYRERCFDRESAILQRLIGKRDILQLVQPKTEFTLQLTDNSTGLSVPVRLSFFVTELADSNMLQYIYSDGVTALRSLRFFRAMCRAVQRLHNHKICHRDIKPENFFRIGKQKVHLGDFGTARVLDGSMPALLAEYHGWRGDKRYTAPEQCGLFEERPHLFYVGDMYSLGAILFEMFTRQSLFTLIFDSRFHHDLVEHFSLIPMERREALFNELIPAVASSRRLPNIDDFDIPIPECIKVRLDRLYKQLACLDYRPRLKEFTEIFHEINMCTTTLENETAYRKRIELKRKWQAERKARTEKGCQAQQA